MAKQSIVYNNGITCILNKHFQIKNDGGKPIFKELLKKNLNQYQYQQESQEAYLVCVQQWGY